MRPTVGEFEVRISTVAGFGRRADRLEQIGSLLKCCLARRCVNGLGEPNSE